MSLRLLLALATAGALLAPVAALAAPAPARTASEYQLIEAAYAGQLTRVRQLLKTGVAVDAQDEYGYTALMWAAQAGWPLTVDVLLKQGATVDARDKTGRTALLLATVRKHAEVVRVLLAAGASVNAADNQGVTPLAYARSQGLTALSNMLARAPQAKGLAGKTPPPVAHAAAHATPHAAPHPTAAPHAAAAHAPAAHGAPAAHAPAHHAAPAAHAAPHAAAHATPKPAAHAAAHDPHAAPHATPAPRVATTGATIELSSGFRAEIARLYGLYTEHLELRNPEALTQRGYNTELETQLEGVFHTLNYGSAATLPRQRLQDARTAIVAARQRMSALGADLQVYQQILDSLEQRLTETGF